MKYYKSAELSIFRMSSPAMEDFLDRLLKHL